MTETEEKIVVAAEKLFVSKGFKATSVRNIAKEADVNVALVNYYFRSKENLFRQVYENKIEKIKIPIQVIADDRQLTLKERISAIIDVHFDFLMQNPDLPRFLVNEILECPQNIDILRHIVGDMMSDVYAKIQNEISDYLNRGLINPIEPFDLLMDIISLDVSPFIVLPIIRSITSSEEEVLHILEARKKEVIELINRRVFK